MRPATQATLRVLTHLQHRLPMTEHEGAARGPWMSMTGQGGTRGHLRCFSAAGLDKIAYLTLEDDDQLDAAMLVGLGPPDSALPHLVLDVAHVARDYGVFVDLVPRVDLAINADYVKWVYPPLTEVIESLRKHPKLRPSSVPASLMPFVSPWMLGFRCGEDMLAQLFELVGTYVSLWLELLQTELPKVRMTPAELAERDTLHRARLFSSAADPVWDVLATVVGAVSAARVVGVLKGRGVPPAPSVRPPSEP